MQELEARLRCLEAAVSLNVSGRLIGLSNVLECADKFVEWAYAAEDARKSVDQEARDKYYAETNNS